MSTEFAGKGQRLAAQILDKLMFAVPFGLAAFVPINHRFARPLIGAGLLGMVSVILVQTVLLSYTGQTIGKKILQIKIVKFATGENGGFITNVLIRKIVNGFIGLTLLYPGIDGLFIFRKDRRCIHDLMAGTCVVRTKPSAVAVSPAAVSRIPVVCSHCEATYMLKPKYAGKVGRCRNCGGKFVVPDKNIGESAR